MTSGISRRTLLVNGALVGGAAFFGPWRVHHAYAQKKDKPILIGLTHDASGQFANSGQAEQRGTIMAIEEANAKGGVLGRKLAYVTADTETTPATGSRVAERFITRNEVAFLVGAIQSGVANAMGQVAQKYGCVYFNTNSSSPTEAGKDCHRVKFVWDGNGANFALAAAANAVRTFGKRWLLLTNDYVWGHNTSKATREIATKFGADVFAVTECATSPCQGVLFLSRGGLGVASNVTVDFATEDGTATALSDYVATTGTVSFAYMQTTQKIVIPLQIEPGAQPTKSFRVRLSNPRGGATLGTRTSAEVRITDTR